ncbi:MAG: hypothetical protein IPK13_24420 [Deltaproteobacteria bacterium]|nr:hypothetical protein [Deltaproteobacteria bacterium]
MGRTSKTQDTAGPRVCDATHGIRASWGCRWSDRKRSARGVCVSRAFLAIRGRRGFSLITVFMLLALASMSAMILLRLVSMEQSLLRVERLTEEAQALADNGVQEVMADRAVELPFEEVHSSYEVSANSLFVGDDHGYEAEIRLLRLDPIRETSMTSLRAVVFEVAAVGRVSNGEATAEYVTEAYRIVGYAPGVVVPAVHYR